MRGLADATCSAPLQEHRHHEPLRRRRTYPGFFPVLHLDHIYYEGDDGRAGVELPRTRLALMASDHLPLVANLRSPSTLTESS